MKKTNEKKRAAGRPKGSFKKGPLKKRVTVRLHPETIKTIDDLSAEMEMTKVKIIENAVAIYFRQLTSGAGEI